MFESVCKCHIVMLHRYAWQMWPVAGLCWLSVGHVSVSEPCKNG